MTNVNESLKLLGCAAQDKVTRAEGIITTVSFDLFGCIQILITPRVNKENKREDSGWYDIQRLKITNKTPVMEQPDFRWYKENSSKGPAEKPIF
jgi:hypothetical protein